MAKATKEVDLAEVLADSLNKQAKDQKVAFFLDNNDSPTNVEGWLNPSATSDDEASVSAQTLSSTAKNDEAPFDVDETPAAPKAEAAPKKLDDVAAAFDDLFNS